MVVKFSFTIHIPHQNVLWYDDDGMQVTQQHWVTLIWWELFSPSRVSLCFTTWFVLTFLFLSLSTSRLIWYHTKKMKNIIERLKVVIKSFALKTSEGGGETRLWNVFEDRESGWRFDVVDYKRSSNNISQEICSIKKFKAFIRDFYFSLRFLNKVKLT